MQIGLISDTHDLLRPEAVAALSGVDRILHAGDVCKPGILSALEAIAPVHAVRGNCDHGAWANQLPVSDLYELPGLSVYAIHDISMLDIDPAAAGVGMVLYGHSHQPAVEERRGVLFVNPGSAGPRRFSLPVTVARLTLGDAAPQLESIDLNFSK